MKRNSIVSGFVVMVLASMLTACGSQKQEAVSSSKATSSSSSTNTSSRTSTTVLWLTSGDHLSRLPNIMYPIAQIVRETFLV